MWENMNQPGYLLFFCVIFASFCTPAIAETDKLFTTDVYIAGEDDYHTYRIPALVITQKGTLLAFCEGRKKGTGDDGDIDLLMKKSSDGGRTWSDLMVVYEDGGDAPITIGNPCPIVERNSHRIHLLFTRNNKRLFYTKSLDDGSTWSPPKEYTSILNQFDYPWVRVATGPVHGLHMTTGRLIAPVWLSNRVIKQKNVESTPNRFRSGILYSDNHGQTWHAGALVPPTINRLNECTVIEKPDGSLLLNMRAHRQGYRAVATSEYAGITWSKPKLDKNLPCPTCQASMIRLNENEILFLNPAVYDPEQNSRVSRRNLTLRLSQDEGKSWSHSRVIHSEKAGYSDMAITDKGTILCLFENGSKDYREKISLVAVNREWLIDQDHE
jgi:sialidase-1